MCGIPVATSCCDVTAYPFPPWRACYAKTARYLGALRNLPHATTQRVIRRPFEGQTGGLGLLVWQAPAGAKDGKRGAFLTGAIDGSASLLTAGDQGESHTSADEAAR